MASYKRVLKAFGRSEKDADFICNVPLHPWDIKIRKADTKEIVKWDGNMRLVGYVDVFFLICFQGENRFSQGIVIYKDEKDERLKAIEAKPASVREKEMKFERDKEKDPKTKEKLDIDIQFDTDSMNYIVNGWGHEIGLRTTFPPAEIYTIELRQSKDTAIEKALRKLSAVDLLMNTAAMTTVSTAEAMGHLVGLGNSRVLENAGEKFKEGMSTKKTGPVAHAGSRE